MAKRWGSVASVVLMVLGCNGSPRDPTGDTSVDEPGADAATPVPTLSKLWEVTNPDVSGRALAIAPDGAVWIAGGAERSRADLSYEFRSYWLAAFDVRDGSTSFEVRDPNVGMARGVAASSERVATITTNYVDGDRTTLVERDRATGELLQSSDILEEANAVLYDDGGRLVLGGVHLLEYVGGRPTSALWLAGFDASLGASWELLPNAPQQGWTGAASLAVSAGGILLVGGFQGVTTQSNASVPWILGVRDAAVSWQHVYDTGANTTGRIDSIVARPEGGALARGRTEGSAWVVALSESGEREWTEPLSTTAYMGTVAVLPSGGYAVTGGSMPCEGGCVGLEERLSVTGYDGSRQLAWEVREPACELAIAAQPTTTGKLVVLGVCDWGLGLFAYALPE